MSSYNLIALVGRSIALDFIVDLTAVGIRHCGAIFCWIVPMGGPPYVYLSYLQFVTRRGHGYYVIKSFTL